MNLLTNCNPRPRFEELDKKENNTFCQYRKKEDMFIPTEATIDKLPPGFYKPSFDSYNGILFFEKKRIIMPKLYVLPNEAKEIIINDIKKFWENEERYRKFGSVYKRNILLYSVPGNGKTCLINLLCKELINKHNGIIVCIDTQKELENYTKVMSKFKQIEPDRKVITIIEDFERLAKDEYFSALLLQLLDGNEQLDNIVTIATTNYPENLEKRWTCRPSRFNLIMEYKKPDAKVREFYIYNKLKDGGIDVESESVKEDIKRYVEKTNNYTFDFLKEVIQCMYVDGLPEDAAFERTETAIKNNGKYKVTENENGKIGFSSKQKLLNSIPEDDIEEFCYDEPINADQSYI